MLNPSFIRFTQLTRFVQFVFIRVNSYLLVFIALATLFSSSAFAQPQYRGSSPEFKRAIEAVLHDYPRNFHSISGELVKTQNETDYYASLVQLPDALECLVGRYHSQEDTTASWQAKMFRGEEFEEAVKKYKYLFNKLKGCYLKLVDGSIMYLDSEWGEVNEEMPFAVSTFRLNSGYELYRNLKIELELVSEITDWVVNINIVYKESDDVDRMLR